MNIRKNARWLSDGERSGFLKCVLSLKGLYEQRDSVAMNLYDFYPLEHRIVRRRRLARNMSRSLQDGGHGGPAFLPWHREWLRRFEKDLQAIDSAVTLPYWDLLDPVGTRDVLFQDDYMGPNGSGKNGEIASGYFREHVPQNQRPVWWPNDSNGTPLPGFPIRRSLSVEERPLTSQRYGFNTTTLTRQFGGNGAANPWLEFPSRRDMEELLALRDYNSFQPTVEGMDLHGWGHVWIGGLMGRPATSPNDPMFFLHHCMIDHVWALWQDAHDQTLASNIPPSRSSTVPHTIYGHNIEDLMWPWDGAVQTNQHKVAAPPQAPFPSSTAVTDAPVFPDDTFLRNITAADLVRGADVIDHRNLQGGSSYSYDTQIPFVLRQGNDIFAWIDPLFGDLNLLGTVHEQDNGKPSTGDMVISAQNGRSAWFDASNKSLHVPAHIIERETDMTDSSIRGSWTANHYGQPLAYLKPNGVLHLKGTVRTNQPVQNIA